MTFKMSVIMSVNKCHVKCETLVKVEMVSSPAGRMICAWFAYFFFFSSYKNIHIYKIKKIFLEFIYSNYANYAPALLPAGLDTISTFTQPSHFT